MTPEELQSLLASIQDGRTSVAEGLEQLAGWPTLDLAHSRLDLQRELRCGHPEVVFGAGKSPGELQEICCALLERHQRFLATRVDDAGARAVLEAIPEANYQESARALHLDLREDPPAVGRVLVLSAGTSDRAVAEEAALTASYLGASVEHRADVGVAGLHRLLAQADALREARVVVVVAGMEGALPSVVGGLVERPVIAVPTSVGYGASFEGLAALLAMLNSCAAGVTVVNIDNGFGAGYAAAQINRLAESPRHE